MCGLAVVVDQTRDRVEECIGRMLEFQTHRGPDGTGRATFQAAANTWIGMGHNRLAILDLSGSGSQPMSSHDGRYTMVFNGEIYNYVELARELGLPEHSDGKRIGDSRVLVESVSRWGADAFPRLRGMWALACFDHHAGTLLLSRDRFGIKPIYLSLEGGRLAIASEVKALLAANDRARRINRAACGRYVAYGLLNSDVSTMFEGITAFPAACFAVVDLHDLRIPRFTRYWEPPVACSRLGSSADVADLRARLEDSVRLHLRSDVPIGVLLSGGVDSSALLGLAVRQNLHHTARALSVVSDDPDLDESRFIDLMADHARVPTHKVNVSRSPMGLLDAVDEASWANDQPLCALSDVSHLMLMRKARTLGLKVLLSGQGSDEQFGGYSKFFYFYVLHLLRNLRVPAAVGLLARSLLRSDLLWEFRIGEAVRYAGASRFASAGMVHRNNGGLLTQAIGAGNSYAERERSDLFSLSLPALLHYEDRMSMWSSVEVRVPFLDHPIVELALSLPPQSKLDCGRTKSVLRKALAGTIPDAIRLRRDKRGFGIPEAAWLRTAYRPAFEEMLRSEMRSDSLGILDQAGVRRGFRAFMAGRAIPNGRQMMRVLLLERFLHRFSSYISQA
jgi:asparagine synthase (glutamine-hydrolysing)